LAVCCTPLSLLTVQCVVLGGICSFDCFVKHGASDCIYLMTWMVNLVNVYAFFLLIL
jgi:hypothetical protein